MLHLVNDASGELVKVPEGENSIGRGALLKVGQARLFSSLSVYFPSPNHYMH